MTDDTQEKSFNYAQTLSSLNRYYRQVKAQILRYQSPTTGLFPCDLSVPNAYEGHVRDSIYCAAALWALAQAYKRIDDDKGRTYELSQSAVKCMRGILSCWLRQADKVERFKSNPSPKNALHVKFHLITGDSVDEDYEHLQIDCVGLYLIFLVQMLQSGLQVIFTTDEVTFVQNLVFYVERAYRTPDYGMWERGTKYNNGFVELHASSIGLAKAALEAVNGENMFGSSGTNWTVIFIDIDAHYRNRSTLDALLPRESASKNTDCSLIPTVSWPAFAIHEDKVLKMTVDKVIRKLEGKFGFKRFFRDGYKTVLEDKNRKHYRPAEIKTFDGIECEWPMFYAYFIIEAVYRNDTQKIQYWQDKLTPLLKQTNEGAIMPKYYYVPSDLIEEERRKPGSQIRFASSEGEGDNVFLWGQSVYIISQLLVDGLLTVNELDPIRRYLPAAERPRMSTRYSSFQRGSKDQSSPSDLVIQIVLIAESIHLQQMLATYGIQTQTPHQVEPIQIWPQSELVKAYEKLGINSKLELSGRPPRPVGILGTSKIYRACGITFICYPLLFELSDFYLSQDMEFVIDDVRSELKFLSKCWKLAGRPTFCMILREQNLSGDHAKWLFELLTQFKRGECEGIKMRIGRVQEFLSSACVEHLDFLHLHEPGTTFARFQEKHLGKQFRSITNLTTVVKIEYEETWVDQSELKKEANHRLVELLTQVENMYAKAQMLHVLLSREGLYYKANDRTIEEHLSDLAQKAAQQHVWAVTRFCYSLLGKTVDSLSPSITAILVRGKQVTIGVFGYEEEVIDKPLAPAEIKKLIYDSCMGHDIIQAVLQQELLINIGRFMQTNPEYFNGILKIRIGWIIQAMQLEINYTCEKDKLLTVATLSPTAVKMLLLQVLQRPPTEEDPRTILWKRQLDGALNRVPKDFYDKVWQILEKTPGGLKVAGYLLPQQPTLSDMTQYELNFSLLVEQMLSRIIDPAYRQIVVETFMVVATILERNVELSFNKTVDVDKLVQEAFTLFQADLSHHGLTEKQDNMNAFFNTAPNVQKGSTTYISRAIVSQLLEGSVHVKTGMECVVA